MEFTELRKRVKGRLSPDELELLEHAWKLTQAAHEGQRRVSGEPYTEHCLQVTRLLAEWGLDAPTLAAGLADTGLAKALGRLAAGIRRKTPGP